MKTTISILIIAMYFLPIAINGAMPYNSDYCDLVWNTTFFGQIDGEFKECKQRFNWNNNRIKREFYLNSLEKNI